MIISHYAIMMINLLGEQWLMGYVMEYPFGIKHGNGMLENTTTFIEDLPLCPLKFHDCAIKICIL